MVGGEGPPSRTVLGQALRLLGIHGSEICELRVSPSGNTIVAETSDQVVRISWCAPLHAEQEARIWRAAGRVGIPVPELVRHGEVGGHQYMVYGRLPGWTEPTAGTALREAGVKLAALHGAVIDPFPLDLVSRPRRRNRFALARLFLRDHGSRLPERVAECVELAESDWTSAFHTPTHGDYRGSNLLARGDRISGVVDWSDARRASPEADLGNVDRLRFRGVLDGYLTVVPRIRGAQLLGYYASRYAALAAAGVMGAGAAIAAVEQCAADLSGRGFKTEWGD